MKKIILGLGTGRCGTTWLSTFLGQQAGVFSSHETIKYDWYYDGPITLDMPPLDRWATTSESIVVEVGSHMLPHVRKIAACFDDVSLIVLKRDRYDTIASWLKWIHPKHNYWVPHALGIWEDDIYDRFFPKFDLETAVKSRCIGAYYNYYYKECKDLQKDFKSVLIETEKLSDLETKKKILLFCGVPTKNERYCVRAVTGKGWQIWDRKMNKKWGNPNKEFPTELLEKLNNGRRNEIKY